MVSIFFKLTFITHVVKNELPLIQFIDSRNWMCHLFENWFFKKKKNDLELWNFFFNSLLYFAVYLRFFLWSRGRGFMTNKIANSDAILMLNGKIKHNYQFFFGNVFTVNLYSTCIFFFFFCLFSIFFFRKCIANIHMVWK